MLTHLAIKQFTIAEDIELDLRPGMTVITGETGAGKSLLFDALSLCLGDRAGAQVVRAKAKQCELTAHFDIQNIPEAKQWLESHDLGAEEDCIIRRTISHEGRSRSYVNGTALPLQLTRQLGNLLVNICGQHEHHALLKRDKQLSLLDNFGHHEKLLKDIREIYKQWQHTQRELAHLKSLNQQQAHLDLLRYQVVELNELALGENELTALEAEHKQLSNSETLIQNCQALLSLTQDEDASILSKLHHALRLCQSVQSVDETIQSATELFQNAIIQTEEAQAEVENYLSKLDLDPERLQSVEARLKKIHDIARKHHIKVDEIEAHHQKLIQECQQLENSEEQVVALEQQAQSLHKEFLSVAKQLTQKRQKASKTLSLAVNKHIHQLGMPHGQLQIALKNERDPLPNPNGLESCDFLFTANPGQSAQALNKVASGGELSRVSLAIQVITAKADGIATLLFDEVDVGIGGGTAEVVGQLLHQLGQQAQVLCVTHQAQVASIADRHYRVEKHVSKQSTHSALTLLETDARTEEIARMIGGLELTEQTMAHAKEMLETTA